LRTRLEQGAADYVASLASPAERQPDATPTPTPRQPIATAPRRSGSAGWGWLAAAACLVLAVLGWVRSPHTEPPTVVTVAPPSALPPTAPTPEPTPPTPAQELAELAAKADTVKVVLAATKDPAAAGVTGNVVWDPATQKGFVRFEGLIPNDPAVHQYQLWVFDAARDKRYPVDGGVFNVPANASEVIIPIHAALSIHKPAAFAVTVEKPGGVVVSARDHVVALGAAS
jgi:anti-sigma-K factor RskA